MTLVDLDTIAPDDLDDLVHFARERRAKQRAADEAETARRAELLWGPALGHYRAQRTKPPAAAIDAPPCPPRPPRRAWTEADLVLCAAQCVDDGWDYPLSAYIVAHFATKNDLPDTALDLALGVLASS